MSIGRRGFLSLSALGGGGLLLGIYAGGASADAQEVGKPTEETAGDFSPSAFIRISADGTVTLVSHKPEMGQGVLTSIPMILAEELDIDWKTVKLEIGKTDPAYGNQMSVGSQTVRNTYQPMRLLGATARAMLVTAAARTWNVPESELTTAAGDVLHAASGRKAGYGELVEKAKALAVPAADTVKLKDPKDFKLMGTRVGGYQNEDIVTGKPLFGLDQKVEGMLFAVYQKCPVFGGKVVSANLEKVRTLLGVKDAFVIEGTANLLGLMPGVAIVADSTWAAISARKQLEVRWDEGDHANDSTAEFTRQAAELGAKADGMSVVRNDGDTTAALASAAKVIEARYAYPLIAHACLEPMNTLAHVQGDRAELWSPTQDPAGAARVASAATGVPAGNIKVHVSRIGGAFGRRYFGGFIAEAAAISKKVGAPVKLTWTREDDLLHDEYRPGGFHHFKGGLDAAGKLVAWQNHFVGFGVAGGQGREGNNLQTAMGGSIDGGQFPGRFVPNFRTVQSLLDCRIPMGPWRCPGNNALGFAIQGFIDELAHAAGKDPVEFRLALLDTPPLDAGGGGRGAPFNAERARGVLQLAAEKAGWGKKFEKGQGAGVAFHYSHQGYVAYVAEVTVSKAGVLKIDRIVAAVDVGRQIVNLSGAEGQIQGSIIDALSAASLQEAVMEKGRMVRSNFADYPLLRMPDIPAKIEIHFLKSDNDPTGLGEPGVPPLAPAVATAVFVATGKRIREFPFSKTDLSWT
ncbi:MAG: xanthine dehydrogenase family protein molybdopterin-binding subunit [Verrucomicrobiaceae bacterium]|nr:MAG: xanthine dehydrogenase family protein molybdopterin-binding subunit [Verrucomicrobiaceae bacterium]